MKFATKLVMYISTLFAIYFLTNVDRMAEYGVIAREMYSLIGNVSILMAIELWINYAKNGNK